MAQTHFEIPKTHKAAVYDKPGSVSFKIVEVETPSPGPGEVLVKLNASGVCYSDLGIMTNSWPALPAPTPENQVGGHEGAGVIVKLGSGAELAGVKVGDRVGIKWAAAICGSCGPCLGGHDALCKAGKISGYFTPGTFQRYALAPANYITPIPDGVSDIDAAPFLCAGVTVYAALRKSNTKPGDRVVIIGAGGGLGHLAVQLASRGFALRVIAVDADDKRQLCLDSGAEDFVSIGSREEPNDTAAAVQKLTADEGAHAVIVIASINPAYATAVPMLRVGGTMVCIGIPQGEWVAIATAYPQLLINKNATIVGSATGNRRDAIEVLDFAARGVVKLHARVEKLENLTQIFEEMKVGKIQGRVVIDLNSET